MLVRVHDKGVICWTRRRWRVELPDTPCFFLHRCILAERIDAFRPPDTKLKQGRDVLARIEDRLVACAAPKWNLIDVIHDGRIPLQEVYATLAEPDGVKLLEARLSGPQRSALAMLTVAPLAAEWPATAIGKLERPTLAILKNRRARMSKLAQQLPTQNQWTTAALQSVISPDESITGATVGKKVFNGATQRTYVRDASMFCKWLMQRGVLAKDPTAGVTVGKYKETQARCVDFPVLDRIYEALPAGPIRDAFGLMMATGAEPQVVERVTADGVRESDQHVYLNGTKNVLASVLDIRTIQELLEHQDVRTTMIYAHVLNRGGLGVRSPLAG